MKKQNRIEISPKPMQHQHPPPDTKRRMTPVGGFAFGLALNVACCLPGAVYYAWALIGVGWFFGTIWALLDIIGSLRTRDAWGIVLGAVGMALCFTPNLWFFGKTSS